MPVLTKNVWSMDAGRSQEESKFGVSFSAERVRVWEEAWGLKSSVGGSHRELKSAECPAQHLITEMPDKP